MIFGLYIGNYRDSKDVSQINQNGITHIIAIHDTARRHFSVKLFFIFACYPTDIECAINYFHHNELDCFYNNKQTQQIEFSQNKEYLLIPASDDPSTNLTQYFQECNDFIHRARLGGGKVLIHW